MNNLKLLRLLVALFFILFASAFIVIILIVEKDRSNNLYIEADGFVDTSRAPEIGWVTSDKIIYTVNANNVRDSYQPIHKSFGYDYATTKQVNFFNLITKETLPYKKGQLISYENGEVLIRLYGILGKSPFNKSVDRRVVLTGKLGSETRKTYRIADLPQAPTGFDKCPNDHSVERGLVSIHLKPEHGCVSVPGIYSKDRRWMYYRADGEIIELMKATVDKSNWSFARWIDWLGAYMIADEANAIGTLKILTPDGKLTLVEMKELAKLARPTRAGMVTAKNSGNDESGLRVLHQGANMQFTDGGVMASEVSPDGCKIAYVTNQKLRVINVCEIFDIAPNASPF